MLADSLPENISFDRFEAYGRIHIMNDDYLNARQEYGIRAALSMNNFIHSLIICGNTYVRENKYRKSVSLYQKAVEIGEEFINIGLPISDSMRQNTVKKIEVCKEQIKYIGKIK